MTFKDIKVGDTVMQCRVMHLGIGNRPSFFIPVTVTRVTPKRFVLENGQVYTKENGAGVGHRYFIRSVEEQVDQTEEMNKAIKKRTDLLAISHIANTLSRLDTIEPYCEELYELLGPVGAFLKEKGVLK